jgi:hypothetical protein
MTAKCAAALNKSSPLPRLLLLRTFQQSIPAAASSNLDYDLELQTEGPVYTIFVNGSIHKLGFHSLELDAETVLLKTYLSCSRAYHQGTMYMDVAMS